MYGLIDPFKDDRWVGSGACLQKALILNKMIDKKMLDKEKNDVYDLEKVIEYLPIQRGGGTGPMKPGNQHEAWCQYLRYFSQ